MSVTELVHINLTSAPVLAFALGVLAAALRTDLRLPDQVTSMLSTYLLLAIGFKGGVALAATDLGEIAPPLAATLLLGIATPTIAFVTLYRLGRFSRPDAAAIAAHYGSVSAVTFTAAVAYTQAAGRPAEGYLPALVAALEVPGIMVAIAFAHGGGGTGRIDRAALREVVLGKSVLLLMGGIAMGVLGGTRSYEEVKPFFVDPFKGALVLFLLDLGVVAGQRLPEVRKAGAFLVAFALAAPVAFGIAGAFAGHYAGMSPAGAGVLGAMAGSASYIAAPAATRVAIPAANPALSLTAALALTFPFNLAVGIPLYAQVAQML